MTLVLDASFSLAWIFARERADQAEQAERALQSRFGSTPDWPASTSAFFGRPTRWDVVRASPDQPGVTLPAATSSLAASTAPRRPRSTADTLWLLSSWS